jgi:S1-C subfamily serine protease
MSPRHLYPIGFAAAVLLLGSYEAVASANGQELEVVAERVKPAVVMLFSFDALGMVESLGTGFYVSEDGRLVTNHHVIDSSTEMVAVTPDGASAPASS